MAMERCEACFSGKVQGVGFRYTACRIAAGLNVTGWVRNLPDERVQMVAEGPPGELDRLLAGIREEMGARIREVQENRVPATGEFDGFGIRYGVGAG
jgi:acylphosphatase